MKRAVSIVLLLIIICFSGCETKKYSSDVTADFSQDAVVTSEDFSYSCKISRKDGVISLYVLSTAAKGMEIKYDGRTVLFTYEDMSYEALGEDMEKNNPVIALYDAFEYLISSEAVRSQKTDDGFRFDGSTSLGKFILYQSDDGSYESIHFLTSELLVEFEMPKPKNSEK